MNINSYYKIALGGKQADEERLFDSLSVIFRLIVHQKVQNREDAKEIIQESLLMIAKNYRKTKFKVSFSAWAYKILKNEIARYYKNKVRRGVTTDESSLESDTEFSWNPDPMLEPRLLECLKEICKSNKRYARILNLKYQGYESSDICRKLGITANNLYVIVLRGRSMLKHCLETRGVD